MSPYCTGYPGIITDLNPAIPSPYIFRKLPLPFYLHLRGEYHRGEVFVGVKILVALGVALNKQITDIKDYPAQHVSITPPSGYPLPYDSHITDLANHYSSSTHRWQASRWSRLSSIYPRKSAWRSGVYCFTTLVVLFDYLESITIANPYTARPSAAHVAK